MADASNNIELNAPNKEIVSEMLNYIDASFEAALPTASKGEIARCKEQFLKEYDVKWKELLDAEKLRKLDIKDAKLDKLEDKLIQTMTLRINKPQESAKEFAEKTDIYKQILFTRVASFDDETPLKKLNPFSKSESQELRNRCVEVLKEINYLNETGKNIDTAILKLRKDNVEYFQD